MLRTSLLSLLIFHLDFILYSSSLAGEMEVLSPCADVSGSKRSMAFAVMEAVVVDTALVVGSTVLCIFMATGVLLNHSNISPVFTGTDERFPIGDLHRKEQPGLENKDASDTDNDDEGDDDDDADEQEDDDGGDEDFSGEEGEDDDVGDPEDDPEANGEGGSDDEEGDDDEGDDDDDGDDDENGEDEEEEEEEEEEEDVQPPAKKRK